MREDLSIKQRSNPKYSLRAYANYLDLHSSTLSQIFKGKRSLPIKKSAFIVEKLKLTAKEKTLFFESLYKTKTNIDLIKIDDLDDRFMLDESYYKVIAEWEHYAVLSLFDLTNVDVNLDLITSRLGLDENRALVVVNNLTFCGLVSQNSEGKLQKSHPRLRTTEDVSNQAIKDSHLEALDMGKKKLEEIEIELRDFSAMTIAMDLEKITEAKTIIREFRQKMSALLRDGHKTDVYQLAIQFYPLTNNTRSMS